MKTLRNIMMAIALTVCGAAQADDYAYLSVEQNGTTTEFSISSISKITFSETDMVLNLTNGTTTNIPLQGLSKMFFSKDITGIQTSKAARSQFSLKNGILSVKGAEGTVVGIYDMNGRRLNSVTIGKEDAEINVSGLGKGAYIIKAGSDVRKVMNK